MKIKIKKNEKKKNNEKKNIALTNQSVNQSIDQ